MRPLAISALLVLLLAGLAVTPMAQAAPPQPACNGIWAVRETVGPVTVFASPPCYEVSVDALGCGSSGTWTEARVGQVTVRVNTCDRLEANSEAAAAPPCTCPPPPTCRTPIATTGPLAQIVSVTLTSDCRVIVEVLPIIACTDPLDGRKAITQGRISVILPCGQIDSCEPPLECYPMSASAAAIEPPICGPDQMCTEPDLGLCDSPNLCNDAGCPYPVGAENGLDVSVAGLRVTHACGPQDLCSGPMRCTNPLDAQAAVLIPPVCIERNIEQGPLTAHVGQCGPQSAYLDLCPGWGSAQRIQHTEDVGGKGIVLVGAEACLPHSPPPASSSALGLPLAGLDLPASNPGPCGSAVDPTQVCPAPYPIRPCSAVGKAAASAGPTVYYTLSDECHLDVFVKADYMDCLWGEQYNPTPIGPLVTLWVWGCAPPYPPSETMSAAPPCTCPPPRPLCYEVNRAIAWGEPLQLDDNCNVTVTLHASCGLQGTDYHQVRASKLTVNYETCQQPPVE